MFLRNIGANQLLKATLFTGSMLLLDYAVNNFSIQQPHYEHGYVHHHHHHQGHNTEDNIAHFLVQLTRLTSTLFVGAMRFSESAFTNNNMFAIAGTEFVTNNWLTQSNPITISALSLFGGVAAWKINEIFDEQPVQEHLVALVR